MKPTYRNTDHEALAIVAAHPELFPKLTTHTITQLRAAAAAIESRPAKAPKATHEPSTRELLDEAARLTQEVARLGAEKQARAAKAESEQIMPTGEDRQTYLDRIFGLGEFAPGTRGKVVDDGPIQRFGQRGPGNKGSR